MKLSYALQEKFNKAVERVDNVILFFADRAPKKSLAAVFLAAGALGFSPAQDMVTTEFSAIARSPDPSVVAAMRGRIDGFARGRADFTARGAPVSEAFMQDVQKFSVDLYTSPALSERDFKQLADDYKTRVNIDPRQSMLGYQNFGKNPEHRDECLTETPVTMSSPRLNAARVADCMAGSASQRTRDVFLAGPLAAGAGLLAAGLAAGVAGGAGRRRRERETELRN